MVTSIGPPDSAKKSARAGSRLAWPYHSMSPSRSSFSSAWPKTSPPTDSSAMSNGPSASSTEVTTASAPSASRRSPRAGVAVTAVTFARGGRQLHEEVPHAPRGADEEDAPPGQIAGGAHESQCGEARERQGSGDHRRDVVGQLGQPARGHADLLGPAAGLDVRDDAGAGGGPAAIGRGARDAPGDVLARRVLAAGGEQQDLAARCSTASPTSGRCS